MLHKSENTWNSGSVFTVANEEEPDVEVEAEGIIRPQDYHDFILAQMIMGLSTKYYPGQFNWIQFQVILLVVIPTMIMLLDHPDAEHTDKLIMMQMIVMLMVVATVYTACYFPINIVWVRHRNFIICFFFFMKTSPKAKCHKPSFLIITSLTFITR